MTISSVADSNISLTPGAEESLDLSAVLDLLIYLLVYDTLGHNLRFIHRPFSSSSILRTHLESGPIGIVHPDR